MFGWVEGQTVSRRVQGGMSGEEKREGERGGGGGEGERERETERKGAEKKSRDRVDDKRCAGAGEQSYL